LECARRETAREAVTSTRTGNEHELPGCTDGRSGEPRPDERHLAAARAPDQTRCRKSAQAEGEAKVEEPACDDVGPWPRAARAAQRRQRRRRTDRERELAQ